MITLSSIHRVQVGLVPALEVQDPTAPSIGPTTDEKGRDLLRRM